MANVRKELDALSQEEKEFIKKIMKLDPVTRGCFKMLTTRETHVENGAMWEVIDFKDTNDPDINEARRNNQAVHYWGVGEEGSTKLLVSVDPNLFFTQLSKVDPEIASTYNQYYTKSRENAISNLTKRLHRYFKKDLKEGRTALRLGLFSVNGSPKATASDGEKIDAYQIDFAQFSSILLSLSEEYKVNTMVKVAPNIYFLAGQFLSPSTQLVGSKLCRDNNALEVVVTPV